MVLLVFSLRQSVEFCSFETKRLNTPSFLSLNSISTWFEGCFWTWLLLNFSLSWLSCDMCYLNTFSFMFFFMTYALYLETFSSVCAMPRGMPEGEYARIVENIYAGLIRLPSKMRWKTSFRSRIVSFCGFMIVLPCLNVVPLSDFFPKNWFTEPLEVVRALYCIFLSKEDVVVFWVAISCCCYCWISDAAIVCCGVWLWLG